MTAAPDTRVPPIPAGTICALGGVTVRVYPRIWPGEHPSELYDCYRTGERPSPEWVPATREQLEVIHV